MENKKSQWKAYLGSGMVMVGSAMAGWGFGSKNGKTATLGTFIMGLGTLFVVDNLTDITNHNAKGMNNMLDALKDHEERIRNMENR